MKEQLYTIPVNDAFKLDCECPVCSMFKSLEENAIEFTMGPSYMEDDIRMETNKIGFCDLHMKKLYEYQNRLGLALILQTHMDETMKHIEKLSKGAKPSTGSLFRKKDNSPLLTYIKNIQSSCFVCDKIERMFKRYIITIFYLYKNDSDFRTKFKSSKGFCLKHYALLHEQSSNELSGSILDDFIKDLNELFITNMYRVREDLEWFTNKFDYRYANEPWKNGKDALPRSISKINGIHDLKS